MFLPQANIPPGFLFTETPKMSAIVGNAGSLTSKAPVNAGTFPGNTCQRGETCTSVLCFILLLLLQIRVACRMS